jgi:hypothetical protein
MFKKKKQPNLNLQPIQKGLYAWTSIHAGSFLLFVESLKDCYRFLFLPGPSEYFLTLEDFSKCVKSGTLEFVEELPNEIFDETVRIFLSCPTNQTNIITNETQNQKS